MADTVQSRVENGVYPDIRFESASESKPYVFINMVATIDGKTVSGHRNEPVPDIGSATDHATMRAIESAADAVMIGAGSLRATKGLHYGPRLKRIVCTQSGNLPYDAPFFSENPTGAYVAVCKMRASGVPQGIQSLVAGGDSIDWIELFKSVRRQLGVERLLVEGGSEVNAALLAHDLVDELFLTVAPLVKLGADTPTYADGTALTREQMLRFTLVSSVTVANEVFLRYRRHR